MPIGNPLFASRPRFDFRLIGANTNADVNSHLFRDSLGLDNLDRMPYWSRPGATFRSMFITQPALKNVRILHCTVDSTGLKYADLLVETGITAGDLFDFLTSLQEQGHCADLVIMMGKHYVDPGPWQTFSHNAQLEQFGKTSKSLVPVANLGENVEPDLSKAE